MKSSLVGFSWIKKHLISQCIKVHQTVWCIAVEPSRPPELLHCCQWPLLFQSSRKPLEEDSMCSLGEKWWIRLFTMDGMSTPQTLQLTACVCKNYKNPTYREVSSVKDNWVNTMTWPFNSKPTFICDDLISTIKIHTHYCRNYFSQQSLYIN